MQARIWRCLVALVFSLAMKAGMAVACSCLPASPPDESLEKADAVFAGRVVDIVFPEPWISRADPVTVTFVVSRSWKGVETPAVSLWTSGAGEACGYEFQLKGEYLVYAYRGTEPLGQSQRPLPPFSTN